MAESFPIDSADGPNDSYQSRSHSHDCWVSFGGNVGDVRTTFHAALELLSQNNQVTLGRRSGLYRTAPMGTQSREQFINSVSGLTTTLSSWDLLGLLQSVENQLGRVREVRWGPRKIDLDLLNHGNRIFDDPTLILPHPALTYRRFVLDPLVEIDANWQHPNYHLSAGDLLSMLTAKPLKLSLAGASAIETQSMSEQLIPKFPALELVEDSLVSTSQLRIQTAGQALLSEGVIIDLRRAPGDILERLTSAFTAIFDVPERVSDW